MKRYTPLIAIGLVLSSGAMAQTQDEHQEHHPGAAAQQTPAPPAAGSPTPSAPAQSPSVAPGQMPMGQMPMGEMMQRMPEQCRSMMQNMPQSCMSMMQQMMQGRMGASSEMQTPAATQSAATKAYFDAADRMHGPMMEGLRSGDADVAFVRGMIAHHQGAIDMAKVALQYGNDAQTKKWADDVIREQQREITEMQEWLKKNTR